MGMMEKVLIDEKMVTAVIGCWVEALGLEPAAEPSRMESVASSCMQEVS